MSGPWWIAEWAQENNQLGTIGKLPGKEDLISRNLVPSFVCPDFHFYGDNNFSVRKVREYINAACILVAKFALNRYRFVLGDVQFDS